MPIKPGRYVITGSKGRRSVHWFDSKGFSMCGKHFGVPEGSVLYSDFIKTATPAEIRNLKHCGSCNIGLKARGIETSAVARPAIASGGC